MPLGIGVVLVVAAVALQAPMLRGAGASPGAATFNIAVSAFEFDPADRTIATGDTIEWSWSTSPDEHNVRFTSGSETSGAPATSDTYSRTFTSAGTYDYYCEVHGTPQGGGMAGTITVQAAATNTPDDDATATRTRTATPEPTETVVGTVTPGPSITPVTPPAPMTNTPAPIVSAVPTTPGGGAGGAVTAPDTGGGGDVGPVVPWWASVVMVVGGLVIAGGGLMRVRV
jgi:plastocyanin